MNLDHDDTFDSICRVCLKYDTCKMVPLVDESGLTCYGKSVMVFANITINKKDGFPSSMCPQCVSELKETIKFKFKCEASNKELQKLSNEHNFKDKIIQRALFVYHFADMLIGGNQYLLNEQENYENYSSVDARNDTADDSQETADQNDTLKQEYIKNENLKHVEINSGSVDTSDILLDNIERMLQGTEDCELEMTMRTPVKRRKRLVQSKIIVRSDGKKVRKTFVRYESRGTVMKKNDKKFVCQICQKTLTGVGSFRQHLERHSDCKYICELCAKGFRCRTDLNVHQAIHHDIGNKYRCDHCNFKVSRRFDLIEHMRLHTGERPHMCSFCGFTFRRRCVWKKHLLLHSEKKVQCPRCPRRFHNRGDMMAHMNNVHERRYVYECAECAVVYAKSCTVRRHMLDTHGVPRERQGPVKRVSRTVPASRRDNGSIPVPPSSGHPHLSTTVVPSS